MSIDSPLEAAAWTHHHYSTQSIAVFAVIIVIGYLLIRSRRDHEEKRQESQPVDPNKWETTMSRTADEDVTSKGAPQSSKPGTPQDPPPSGLS